MVSGADRACGGRPVLQCSQPNICLRSIFTTKYLPMLNVHKKYLHPLNVHKKYLPKLNVPKETLIICSIVHNHMLTYTHCSLENICLRSMFITKYLPKLNVHQEKRYSQPNIYLRSLFIRKHLPVLNVHKDIHIIRFNVHNQIFACAYFSSGNICLCSM